MVDFQQTGLTTKTSQEYFTHLKPKRVNAPKTWRWIRRIVKLVENFYNSRLSTEVFIKVLTRPSEGDKDPFVLGEQKLKKPLLTPTICLQLGFHGRCLQVASEMLTLLRKLQPATNESSKK